MDPCRSVRLSGAIVIVIGAALMAYAALEGELSFALVLIVPVIYGSGPLAALAALMVFAGAALVFLSFLLAAVRAGAEPAPGRKVKEWGAVVLIGPVPIIIGSGGALRSKSALVLLAILSFLFFALFLLIYLR